MILELLFVPILGLVLKVDIKDHKGSWTLVHNNCC